MKKTMIFSWTFEALFIGFCSICMTFISIFFWNHENPIPKSMVWNLKKHAKFFVEDDSFPAFWNCIFKPSQIKNSFFAISALIMLHRLSTGQKSHILGACSKISNFSLMELSDLLLSFSPYSIKKNYSTLHEKNYDIFPDFWSHFYRFL